MEHSPALDARIAELASKLNDLNPKITSCQVVVDEVDRHKTKGNQFEVHVVLHVPGRGEVVSSKHSHEDAYLAVNDAFATVTRELEKAVEIQRGDVKRHANGRDPDFGEDARP